MYGQMQVLLDDLVGEGSSICEVSGDLGSLQIERKEVSFDADAVRRTQKDQPDLLLLFRALLLSREDN